jgi:alpha-L-rhamnosidase
MVKHRGHLSVGLTGMQWFMQALTDAGHPEVAYHVATRTTRPSWGYMISKGGTSMWERWDQDTRDPGMNGESQLILAGNLGAWFYQTLGGINCDSECPAFKHIILRPRPVGDLKWVKTSFKSPHGTIRSDWNIEGETFHWQITVPPNTTATVHIPTRDAASVRENEEPAKDRAGIQFLHAAETTAIYKIGSGTYDFAASKPAIPRLP